MNAFMKVGVAYLGYNSNHHWTGAVTGLVGLELAKSGNLLAGASGVATLGVIGLTNIVQQGSNPIQNLFTGQAPIPPLGTGHITGPMRGVVSQIT